MSTVVMCDCKCHVRDDTLRSLFWSDDITGFIYPSAKGGRNVVGLDICPGCLSGDFECRDDRWQPHVEQEPSPINKLIQSAYLPELIASGLLDAVDFSRPMGPPGDSITFRVEP